MRSARPVTQVVQAFDTATAYGLTAPVAVPADRLIAKRRVRAPTSYARLQTPRLPSPIAAPQRSRATAHAGMRVLLGVAAGCVGLFGGSMMALNNLADSCML